MAGEMYILPEDPYNDVSNHSDEAPLNEKETKFLELLEILKKKKTLLECDLNKIGDMNEENLSEFLKQIEREDFEPSKYKNLRVTLNKIPSFLLSKDDKKYASKWTRKLNNVFTRKMAIYPKFYKYKEIWNENYIQILLNSAAQERKMITHHPQSCIVFLTESNKDFQEAYDYVQKPSFDFQKITNAKLLSRCCILKSRAIHNSEPLKYFLFKTLKVKDFHSLFSLQLSKYDSHFLACLANVIFEYSFMEGNEFERIEFFAFAQRSCGKCCLHGILSQMTASYRYNTLFPLTDFGQEQFERSLFLFSKIKMKPHYFFHLENTEEIHEHLRMAAMIQWQVWERSPASFYTLEVIEEFKKLHIAFGETISVIQKTFTLEGLITLETEGHTHVSLLNESESEKEPETETESDYWKKFSELDRDSDSDFDSDSC